MIPVVSHERTAILCSAVIRNHNLVVELFLCAGNTFVRIGLTHPRNHQFQVWLCTRALRRTIIPVLGIHIHREGIVKISVFLEVKAQIITVFIGEFHRIRPIREILRFRCLSTKGGVFNTVYKVYFHTAEHRLPDLFAYTHLRCHIYAHCKLGCVPGELDCSGGGNYLIPSPEGKSHGSAHDKISLEMT